MEWLHDTVGFLVLAVLAPAVLYLQYKLRWTPASRMVAAGILVCGAAAYLLFPARALFPLQSKLSKRNFDVKVICDPNRKVEARFGHFERGGRLAPVNQVEIKLPIEIRGVPEDVQPVIESYGAYLEAPGGETTQLGIARLSTVRTSFGMDLSGSSWLTTPQFLNAEHGKPLTLHAYFYLTLLGNTRDYSINLSKTPTDIADGVQCYAGMLNQLECRAPFRWPARIVSQKSSGTGTTPLTRLISYSPFPTGLDLDPVVRKTASLYTMAPLPANRPVTIEVEEPLAWLRRDLEVRNLDLDQ
jgi:hypothetical protein